MQDVVLIDEDTVKVKPTHHEEATGGVEPASPGESGAESQDGATLGGRGGGSDGSIPVTPVAAARTNKIDLPTPYLPLIPSVTGILVMSYLLWKYFGMLDKRRKRYRRAPQIRGPSLEQQIVDHVDQPGPREYYIVKERKPRSTPIEKRKKRAVGRRGAVRRRMIIDIHLEVLDECQKGDTKLVQEDFFEILVQEFMGSEFMKEESVLKEQVPLIDVPKEQVPSSDSGFRERRLCSGGGCS
ncbi:SICA antigen [Plasmodium coatneyi]|uniref:SICA antigen n=1 Tax=Plasmodium coatneyi TaxID=208452 RepID=A0A1B1DWP6_9APIC|nr:SICA antigen [Plasmodium coatneyi]ANQ07202.1 SICA antigen [Plasmodium coatneyi]